MGKVIEDKTGKVGLGTEDVGLWVFRFYFKCDLSHWMAVVGNTTEFGF